MTPIDRFNAALNSPAPSSWPGMVHFDVAPPQAPAPRWRGLLVVLLVAVAGGAFAAWLTINHSLEIERQELAEGLHRAARTLTRETVASAAIGAAIVMGLNEPAFKEAVRGLRERDAPDVLSRLAVARERFGADGALLIAADGLVVAHEGASVESARATGINLAYRPYLAQALGGVESVYGVVGAASGRRTLIFAAPVYEGASTTGRVIGALILSMPIGTIERTLFAAGQDWLLLSPQGVVFMSNRPDWRFAVAPSVDTALLEKIRAGRQFGPGLSHAAPIRLPFDPASSSVQLGGARQLMAREPVHWNDPGGPWQLVALSDATRPAPLSEPLGFGAAALVTIGMFGLLLRSLLRNRTHNAAIQARFQTLGTALERSALSVIVTDARGEIDWVNPQFERTTQYALGEVRGKTFDAVAGELRSPEVRRDMAAALQHGRPWSGELVSRRKDASRLCERVSLSPVLDGAGKCLGVVGLHEDITETAKAQSELARRLATLSALLESAPDALLLIDSAGTIQRVNRACEAMFGHDRLGLVGSSARMLLPARFDDALGEQPDNFVAALDHAATDHRATLFGLRKSGDEFPLDLRLAPLLHGPDAGRFVVSARDATLRHASDKRTRDALERERAIFDHLPPTLFACDGLCRKVNPAFVQLFGHHAEAIAGRPTSILFESGENYAAFSAQFAPALSRGEPVHTEWRLRRADGSTLVARIRGQAMPVDGGGLGAVWLIEPLSGAQRGGG